MNSRSISVFLLTLFCFSIVAPTFTTDYEEPLISHSITSSDYYAVYGSITIESDQDFIDYGFLGNGSVENPYRLERLNITSNIAFSKAISIRNTHAFFIIRDCVIKSQYIGIALLDMATGTGSLINNTLTSISGDGGGILIQTVNCTISENRCVNWAQGVHLNQASLCTISRNNISDSTYQGINIRYSDNNTIINNRIHNSTQHGLAFVGTSKSNVAYNNIFTDNGNVAEYEIDGERNGTLKSQGYDEGSNNTWYDLNSKIGNFWSDYSGYGSYTIDGPANNFDLYPIISDSSQIFVFITSILAISGIAISLIAISYRRLHK